MSFNSELLRDDIQRFIETNVSSDINSLLLKGSPFSGITVQELAQQVEGKQKALKKLPLWHQTKNIVYPKKINLEQTSSEKTAEYKTKLIHGDTLIDLTGGFGIDCTYFSKTFKEVHHCELNENLSEIVSHNSKLLNTNNLQTHTGDSLEILKKINKPMDWIYVDPSRRNDKKGKVFLLEDCLPNVPDNLDFLFKYTNNILIKNSPILDISSTIEELKFVKEIHIVALQNEVKELLFILEKEYNGAIHIKTINLLKENSHQFDFTYNHPTEASYGLPENYLYEPNAAIMKSGGFQNIATKFNINKLHQHAHLYTSVEKIENFPGRTFKIESITNYDKKKIAKLIPNKKANITTRNFPETVAQIRKKTKIKDGGDTFLFFTTNTDNKHIVLICSKV